MRVIDALITMIVLLLMLGGCAAGHDDYVNFENNMLGKKMPFKEPFKFDNAGELLRADFLLGGQGLTHITKDQEGNLIYHFSGEEVLSNFNNNNEWVGKCLTYSVVDPKTFIIKAWGFDEGGNPLSCRTWP
jgi:hypothetical protein